LKRKGKGKENTRYLGHKFVDRLEPIPERILSQCVPLDEYIDWTPTYEQIAEAFSNPVPVQQAPTNVVKEEPKKGNVCPYGALFGVDTDKIAECGDCKIWDDCLSYKKELRKTVSSDIPF
jgi:hypothetical protein